MPRAVAGGDGGRGRQSFQLSPVDGQLVGVARCLGGGGQLGQFVAVDPSHDVVRQRILLARPPNAIW